MGVMKRGKSVSALMQSTQKKKNNNNDNNNNNNNNKGEVMCDVTV